MEDVAVVDEQLVAAATYRAFTAERSTFAMNHSFETAPVGPLNLRSKPSTSCFSGKVYPA